MKTLQRILLGLAFLASVTAPAFAQVNDNIVNSEPGIAYNANVTTVTASTYKVQKEDHTILVNAASAASTITLPAAGSARYPYLVIKKTDSTVNAVTIDGAGSQTIDGATTLVLSLQYASVVLHANATTWQVVASLPVISATENVTATNVITAAESGKTFFLNSATEFVSTLPAPKAGLRFTFIVAAAPSGASYTVITTSSANIIKGKQVSVAGDAGDTGTADDTISFVDGQAVAGDRVEVWSDGTSWFAVGISNVAAGLTFTQAS